ncbi:MAG: MFS transporter, partial [Acidobacteriota bacterium]|nr:MFS transporter [Acidobacteriota bacterium]
MRRPRKLGDAGSFGLIWLGQTVSLIGSRLSFFALSVWIFQTTGSSTQFTAAVALGVLPGLLAGPFIGALIDRWDRRRAMILADSGSAVITLVLAYLVLGGDLAVWHIYVAIAIGSVLDAAQVPAYSAAVTLLVRREHLGRANGLIQFGESGAKIIAPAAAGLLLPIIDVGGILLIDLITFAFAIFTLLLAHVPLPKLESVDGKPPSLLQEAIFGWRYIRRDSGLKALLLFFAVFNLLWGVNFVLITPLVLSFTNATDLGFVLAVSSAASLVGGL